MNDPCTSIEMSQSKHIQLEIVINPRYLKSNCSGHCKKASKLAEKQKNKHIKLLNV